MHEGRKKEEFNNFNKTILELGSGEGCFGKVLKKKGYNVICSDLNTENFGVEDIECLQIDVNHSLDFEDEKFDYVIAIEVIEHLENPYNLIHESYRILKKGGKLILTTPNTQSIYNRLFFLITGHMIFFNNFYLTINHISPIFLFILKHIIENKFEIKQINFTGSPIFISSRGILNKFRFPDNISIFGENIILELEKL